MAIKYLDAKRVQGVSLAGHSDPMVIGGTSSGTGSSTWADGTQDGSDHTVWYDIRRGVTVGEDDHQDGNGVTGLANASTNGGDGFVDHPNKTNASQGSDSQWGIRFKLTIDSITTNSSSTVKVGIGMSSSNGDNGGGHEGSLVMKFNNSTRKFMCTGSKSGGDTDDSAKTKEIGSNMMATGTWYCTVWQLPVTSYTRIKARVTTNSDYTTSSTTSDYTQDNDNWGNEDSNFVKYFRVFNSNGSSVDNHVYFKVEDMKLWNGTNDFTTTPTTTVDMAHSTGVGSSSTGAKSRYTQYNERNPLVIREEANWENNGTKMNHTPVAVVEKAALLASPTLLQENTIFEETDTYKTYFLQSDAWEQSYPRTPTYEADFSSADGWAADTAGSFSIDTSNETLDFHVQRASTIYDIGKDLTGSTVSQDAWLLRFKMVVNTLTTAGSGAGAGIIGVFGLSSVNSSSESSSLDAIAMKLVFSSSSEERIIGLVTPNQGNFTQTQTNLTTTGLATGTYYVELKRTSQTQAVLSFSSTNSYNGNLFSTQTATIANTLENLRYLNWKTFTGNPSDPDNHMHGEISELKFWNGVTEP